MRKLKLLGLKQYKSHVLSFLSIYFKLLTFTFLIPTVIKNLEYHYPKELSVMIEMFSSP